VGGQEVVFLADDGLQRAGAVLLGAGGDAFDAGGCGLPDDLLEAVGDATELVGGVVAVEAGEPFGVGGEERREGGDVPGFGSAVGGYQRAMLARVSVRWPVRRTSVMRPSS
jgi:hypothetical protein